MLQPSMWSQLARLKLCRPMDRRRTISVDTMGPMKTLLNSVEAELRMLKDAQKHWSCKGRRSIAMAAIMLQQDSIVAIPTDTIYGLAGIASSSLAIEKLYEIKKRDGNKPLSISISNVRDVKKWGVADHLQPDLLATLLPGPYTVVLKRTPALNPALNPNFDTVGIRVPNFTFIRCVAELTGPLALTSANESNEPNCIYPSEFEKLWPSLNGIFYDCTIFGKASRKKRRGSTIVDLSEPGYYKIIRYGIGTHYLIDVLKRYELKDASNDPDEIRVADSKL